MMLTMMISMAVMLVDNKYGTRNSALYSYLLDIRIPENESDYFYVFLWPMIDSDVR